MTSTGPVNADTILRRAIAGQTADFSRLFRPFWLYYLHDDPFWIWCEYHAPDEQRVDETTLYDQYRRRMGEEWERRYIAENFPNAYEVTARWRVPALRETAEAMVRGNAAIHGAALGLFGEEVFGKADLLVRSDDRPSDLGDYHYRVQEVKNSAEVKTYHAIQAAAYNWMLGELQGFCPTSFDVVLRDGAGVESVAYADAAAEMQDFIAEWRRIRDGGLRLQPIGLNSTAAPWRKYANEIIRARKDISLIPGIGLKTASDLRERGFASLDEILALGPDGCLQEFGNHHHFYHALAYQKGRPVFRPGDTASIRRRDRIVHFDVEDIIVVDGETVNRPHVYMIGVAMPEGETIIWTARGEDDESRMWRDFLDWLGDSEDVALYCWSSYESTKLQQAARGHPALADRLLAAKASLIDLKDEIKHRPYFPVSSYSIKEVAPVCGFHWSQDDVDGRSAQLMYVEWLKSGDDAIIRKVEQYNREDALAMLAVDRYVEEVSPAGRGD